MSISHRVFDEYTRIDILTHWPRDQIADILNKFLHIAGCSTESKLCGLDVFRRQTTAGTSDDIDHRGIQNFTLPHFMTVERHLYVFVFILYSVLMTLFLLMILCVYVFYHCP